MRNITEKVVSAFVAGRKRTIGNSESTGISLLLHGNAIAWRLPDGDVYASLAGWGTPTTRERLNGLCELLGLDRKFHQHRGCQMFGQQQVSLKEVIMLKGPSE